jgi:type IV secretory pathway protease TraF
VFALGDNRGSSADSRVIGPVAADAIVGRAVARVWPPSRTAFL